VDSSPHKLEQNNNRGDKMTSSTKRNLQQKTRNEVYTYKKMIPNVD